MMKLNYQVGNPSLRPSINFNRVKDLKMMKKWVLVQFLYKQIFQRVIQESLLVAGII